MDDMVKAAMAKWPHVPACYGWLGLDRRGHWWMRDEAAQACGPFSGPGATPASRGARLEHAQLIAFIHRNYAADEQGRWYFQNGPQRVFVELDRAPWIWRLQTPETVTSHTGQTTSVRACQVDEAGLLYLDTPMGWGLVHTQDMDLAADWLIDGRWTVTEASFESLRAAAGVVLSPLACSRAGSDSDEHP